MTSFKKVGVVHYPQFNSKITPESLYWKNLEFPITRREERVVFSKIDFSSVQPYNYAVTSSCKVQIFSKASSEGIQEFSRFKGTVYGGSFNKSATLLVAGSDQQPFAQLFNVGKRNLLSREFKGHSGPVHIIKFISGTNNIFTGSDDRSVRLYDFATESLIHQYSDHQDYVRSGAENKGIIATGSYDRTVRLYDPRTNSSVMTLDHDRPVESVLFHPTGNILVTASGTTIRLWDLLAGGKPLLSLTNHTKTITDLSYCKNYQNLASSSLDKHIKVYDVIFYKVVHTLDYPSPVLSFGIAPDDSLVAVGMVDGLLSSQRMKEDFDPLTRQRQKNLERKSSYGLMVQRKRYQPNDETVVVKHERKDFQSKHDKCLKKFRHSEALDAVMELGVRSRTPEVTVALMQELIRRGALRAALAGRDEKSLCDLLTFVKKNLYKQEFVTILADVTCILLDIYEDQIPDYPLLIQKLKELRESVNSEENCVKEMEKVKGVVRVLLTASQQQLQQQVDFADSNTNDVSRLLRDNDKNNDECDSLIG